MIDMTVGKEQLGVDLRLAAHERVAEQPDPAPGVENDHVLAATNLDARRVAAIAGRIRAGRGNTAPNPPEADGHR